MTERYYDNSMLDEYRRCPRKYLFCHIFHWKPERTSHHLIFGLCWHAAMDQVWQFANSNLTDEQLHALAVNAFIEEWRTYYPIDAAPSMGFIDSQNMEDEMFPKTPGRAADMLHWYIKKKRAQLARYEILGIEVPFMIPLSEKNDSPIYIGRKDKIYRVDGHIYDADHKTTKSDASYWRDQFTPNSQMDGYMYVGFMTYQEAYKGIMIDGALCQKGSAKKLWAPDLPPGIGFPTVSLERSYALIDSWLWETADLINGLEFQLEMLADCKDTDPYLKAFGRRTTACGYYDGCVYRTPCSFFVNPLREQERVPLGFKKEKWEPFSLADVTKKDVEAE